MENKKVKTETKKTNVSPKKEVTYVHAEIYLPTAGTDPKTGRPIDTTKTQVWKGTPREWKEQLPHLEAQGYYCERLIEAPSGTPTTSRTIKK